MLFTAFPKIKAITATTTPLQQFTSLLRQAWDATKGIISKIFMVILVWFCSTAFIAMLLMQTSLPQAVVLTLTNTKPPQDVSTETLKNFDDTFDNTDNAIETTETKNIAEQNDKQVISQYQSREKIIESQHLTPQQTTQLMHYEYTLHHYRSLFFILLFSFTGWYFIPCLLKIALYRVYNQPLANLFLDKACAGKIILLNAMLFAITRLMDMLIITDSSQINVYLVYVGMFISLILYLLTYFSAAIFIVSDQSFINAIVLSYKGVLKNLLYVITVALFSGVLYVLSMITIAGLIWAIPFLMTLKAVLFSKIFDFNR